MLDAYKLVEIRELYGMSQGDLAKQIGYSREVVNKIESGKIKASKFFVRALHQFLDTHQKGEISQDVNILGKASQGANRAPFLLQRMERKNETAPVQVPLVGIKAQAGYVKGYEEVDFVEALDKYSLPPGVNGAGAVWRYFEIDGDSMEPTLSSGDVVLATMVPQIDWQDLRNFSVYVIHLADQLLVKRIFRKSDHQWVLISDNEEVYPQIAIDVETVKQVWLLRRHIRSKAPMPKEIRITA